MHVAPLGSASAEEPAGPPEAKPVPPLLLALLVLLVLALALALLAPAAVRQWSRFVLGLLSPAALRGGARLVPSVLSPAALREHARLVVGVLSPAALRGRARLVPSILSPGVLRERTRVGLGVLSPAAPRGRARLVPSVSAPAAVRERARLVRTVLAPAAVRDRARLVLARNRPSLTSPAGAARARKGRVSSLNHDRFYRYGYVGAPAAAADERHDPPPGDHSRANGSRPKAAGSDAETTAVRRRPSDVPCVGCGTPLPAHARYCFACGAARAQNGAAPAGEAHERPLDRGDTAPAADPQMQPLDRSESATSAVVIDFWRGYVTAEFLATATNGGDSWVAARSPGFRWRGRGEPPEDDPRAARAHEALLEALVTAGWEPVGRGPRWYACHLRRRSDDADGAAGDRPSEVVPHKRPQGRRAGAER